MLLAANRFFGVEKERALPAILHGSRLRQANVTSDLAEQVFSALEVLLRGFEVAAERDGGDLLSDAVAREGDHLYRGLLTVLLRVVFVLYAEDRGLLPIEQSSEPVLHGRDGRRTEVHHGLLRAQDGSYRRFAERFAIRRSNPRFWETSDFFNDAFVKAAPDETGIIDLTRYAND